MDNRYYRHNRRKYSLKVHIVLVTKYLKQLLQGSIADDVKQKILDIANTRGYEIIAMETDKVLLNKTMSVYCDACNYVSDYVFRTHDLKQFSLNKILYSTLRE